MTRIIYYLVLIIIIVPSLYAFESQTQNGRKNDIKTLVNADVVDLKIGPEMPIKKFNTLSDKIKKKYASAQYRLVFTNAEIYTILFIDFLAIWEGGDKDIIDSYAVPLDGYTNMKFQKWNSYDNFDLIIETINKEKLVNITIMPNGKFIIKEKNKRDR
jgi:hypothetical protein